MAFNINKKTGKYLSKEEIAGFEELSGIPGTIGGAVIMNAGAHGKEIKESLGFTPRSKRVLENAFLEAKRIGYNYIGTEHLLLALMKEGDCIAIKIILELNVEISQIYNEVAKVINEEEIDNEIN